MSAHNTYKKDKAIIKALMSAPANKFGTWYGIIGSLMALGLFIIAEVDPDNYDMTIMSFMLMGFMNMLGIILALNGSTVFTGEKNSAQAREMTKGAYNQLPTFLCMPVKRESLYRWQFERIMFFVFIPCIYALVISIYSMVKEIGISLDVFISIGTVLSVTLSCFLISYGIVFSSSKVKKLLNVFYIASIMIMTFANTIFVFNEIIFEEFGEPVFRVDVNVPNGGIILIVTAAAFPAVIYLLYKNIILKRMGGGWYE